MAGDEGYYLIHLTQECHEGRDMWTASHPALLGCQTVAPDPWTALQELTIVRDEWLERARADGATIPAAERDFQYTLVLSHEHTADHEDEARRALTEVASAAQEVETYQFG